MLYGLLVLSQGFSLLTLKKWRGVGRKVLCSSNRRGNWAKEKLHIWPKEIQWKQYPSLHISTPELSPLHHTASQAPPPGQQPGFLFFPMWETNSEHQNQVIPQKKIYYCRGILYTVNLRKKPDGWKKCFSLLFAYYVYSEAVVCWCAIHGVSHILHGFPSY